MAGGGKILSLNTQAIEKGEGKGRSALLSSLSATVDGRGVSKVDFMCRSFATSFNYDAVEPSMNEAIQQIKKEQVKGACYPVPICKK